MSIATLEKIRTIEYDLVILDIKLPDKSGLELLPEIKNQCPVIIFSEEDLHNEVSQQVVAYLAKATISNEMLLDTIRRVINRANIN